MKTIIISLLFVLLAWVPSCKKRSVQEQIDPPQKKTSASCRIVGTIYKTPTISRKVNLIIEPETITLDGGEKIQVSTVVKTTYKYDEQGRIVEVREQLLLGDYRLIKYTYRPANVIIDTETLGHQISNKPYVLRDTTQLNEQGLAVRYNDLGVPYLLYNADRQPVGTTDHPGRTHVYINGNLTQELKNATWAQRNGEFVPVDYQLNLFTYNTDRPNLPVIYQFRGQLSRNLPTKEIWEMHQSSQFSDGPVYQKIYTYSYDKQGWVKRRVVNGKALNPGWLIEDDTYGVGVTDYEYECP